MRKDLVYIGTEQIYKGLVALTVKSQKISVYANINKVSEQQQSVQLYNVQQCNSDEDTKSFNNDIYNSTKVKKTFGQGSLSFSFISSDRR